MRLAGNDARIVSAPTTASAGPFVIALFADYLPNKGRGALREDTVAMVKALAGKAAAMRREVVLVGLGGGMGLQWVRRWQQSRRSRDD